MREVGHEPLFAAAFPGEENPLNFDNIARAIAAFERTRITPGAPFDRYLAGDESALTPKQKEGLRICQEAGCIKLPRWRDARRAGLRVVPARRRLERHRPRGRDRA
ncbi:MAG TPA: cytochrome-c peroxidase [Longimicrobiales bacterium]